MTLEIEWAPESEPEPDPVPDSEHHTEDGVTRGGIHYTRCVTHRRIFRRGQDCPGAYPWAKNVAR